MGTADCGVQCYLLPAPPLSFLGSSDSTIEEEPEEEPDVETTY